MSAQNFVQAIGAGATVKFPGGNFFYIRTASGPIDVETEGTSRSSPVRFVGLSAGTKFGPVADPWLYLKVTSATAQTVEIAISDDGNFEVAAAVSVTGTATTQELPSSALADTVDTAQAASTETAIAANLSRRRITIGVLSTSANGVRVSFTGGANTRGIEIQPGTFQEFKTTAALKVRNADIAGNAAVATWYAEEET